MSALYHIHEKGDMRPASHRGNPLQYVQIMPIHRKDQPKSTKIIGHHPARPLARYVGPMAARNHLRPPVRSLAFALRRNPGGVAFDLQSCPPRGQTKGSLGHGRTAMISPTDE